MKKPLFEILLYEFYWWIQERNKCLNRVKIKICGFNIDILYTRMFITFKHENWWNWNFICMEYEMNVCIDRCLIELNGIFIDLEVNFLLNFSHNTFLCIPTSMKHETRSWREEISNLSILLSRKRGEKIDVQVRKCVECLKKTTRVHELKEYWSETLFSLRVDHELFLLPFFVPKKEN